MKQLKLCVPAEGIQGQAEHAAPTDPSQRVAQGMVLSVTASSSARLLRSTSILPVSQQAWQKVSHGCLKGYRSVAPVLDMCDWLGVRLLPQHRVISIGDPPC